MAYDEELATKIADVLAEQGDFDERKMFGGIAFMVKGHMCCGVINEELMLRLGTEGAAKASDDAHVRPMDFTGRPMKGYVFIAKQGVRTEAKLRERIREALDFVATLRAK